MLQLQINSPEMKDIFETKFHSNQEKFMEFIVSFVQDNKRAIDNYFHKNNKPTFKYKKLNPILPQKSRQFKKKSNSLPNLSSYALI